MFITCTSRESGLPFIINVDNIAGVDQSDLASARIVLAGPVDVTKETAETYGQVLSMINRAIADQHANSGHGIVQIAREVDLPTDSKMPPANGYCGVVNSSIHADVSMEAYGILMDTAKTALKWADAVANLNELLENEVDSGYEDDISDLQADKEGYECDLDCIDIDEVEDRRSDIVLEIASAQRAVKIAEEAVAATEDESLREIYTSAIDTAQENLDDLNNSLEEVMDEISERTSERDVLLKSIDDIDSRIHEIENRPDSVNSTRIAELELSIADCRRWIEDNLGSQAGSWIGSFVHSKMLNDE